MRRTLTLALILALTLALILALTLAPKLAPVLHRHAGSGRHLRARAGARARLCAPALGLITLLVLTGCARDTEGSVRARIAPWFFLGETVVFTSSARCTGAIFAVQAPRPRHALPVHATLERATQALQRDGVAALRVATQTPSELTDRLLQSTSARLGQGALAAAALSGQCFEQGPARAALFAALTRPGATLVFDAQAGMLLVLDGAGRRLYLVAGDVW